MSAVIAEPIADAPSAPVKRSKKKLIVIGAVVLLLLLAAAGGAAFYMKSKAAHAAAAAAAAGDEEGSAKGRADDDHSGGKADPAHPPTFLPLEAFVVNLADKEADRYLQIGITLEVESAGFADQAKAYMPAIRNAILLIIAGKTSRDLLDRSGKELLASEIQREAVRPMGIEIGAPGATPPKAGRAVGEHASAELPAAAPAKVPPPHGPAVPNPIRHVHFSSFIIQ